MRLDNCEAKIVKTASPNMIGEPHEGSTGYVHMHHGDVYGIWVRNHIGDNTDVIIEIDGKEVGGWRLGSNVAATIERPADDTGKFTFYEIGSSEGQKIGLDAIAREDLGLVKVTFIPELRSFPGVPTIELQSYSGAKRGA